MAGRMVMLPPRGMQVNRLLRGRIQPQAITAGTPGTGMGPDTEGSALGPATLREPDRMPKGPARRGLSWAKADIWRSRSFRSSAEIRRCRQGI